jgi:hypothetical protein
MTALPRVRSHEIMDYRRCPMKWYWHWRMGLVPKAVSFGALDLGTWVHTGFQNWYGLGVQRNGVLRERFAETAAEAIAEAKAAGAPDYQLERADELAALGEAMMEGYTARYGNDEKVHVLAVEPPLHFTIPNYHDAAVGPERVLYLFKPDMVYRDLSNGGAWLMENKTAASIRTEHLPIDGQARPYGVFAARALTKLGIIKHESDFKGIMYNYLRKAVPDARPINEKGLSLNKNGTVSARQPAASFLRKPVILTRKAKVRALERLRSDTMEVAIMAEVIRSDPSTAARLPKTPHHSCPKFCDYFTMCVEDENGNDTTQLRRALFTRVNPYTYPETTDERATFEMG